MDEFRTGAEAASRPRTTSAGCPLPARRAPCSSGRDLARPRRLAGRRRPSGRSRPPAERARLDLRGGRSSRPEARGTTSSPARRRPRSIPLEEIACRLGRLAGTAAHVLEAGAVAARERGYYSSSLMDFREVQERLAGLVSGAELARLGPAGSAASSKGERRTRPSVETAGPRRPRRGAGGRRPVRGRSLLGPSWVAARLPADEGPSCQRKDTIMKLERLYRKAVAAGIAKDPAAPKPCGASSTTSGRSRRSSRTTNAKPGSPTACSIPTPTRVSWPATRPPR